MRVGTTLNHTRAPGSEPQGHGGRALQTLQASAGLCGAKRKHCLVMPKLGKTLKLTKPPLTKTTSPQPLQTLDLESQRDRSKGVMVRRSPTWHLQSLVQQKLTTKLTGKRAPGPSAIRKIQWKTHCNNF